jgi:hypothetical protein
MKESQIKAAITKVFLESLNEEPQKRWQPPTTPTKTWDLDVPQKTSGSDKLQPHSPKWQYENGKKWGVKDKLSGVERELDKYSPSFVKGYKEVQSPGWWTKFNDKLTQLLAQLGSGVGK